MGYTHVKSRGGFSEADIKKYNGTVVSGQFIPYKKTYKDKIVSKVNVVLSVILGLLILFSIASYYYITSSEIKLNKIRKETLMLNDENMELQNKLDYLKSYSNVNARMQSSNIVEKAKEVVEVPAKEVQPERDTHFDTVKPVKIKKSFKWSLGY